MQQFYPCHALPGFTHVQMMQHPTDVTILGFAVMLHILPWRMHTCAAVDQHVAQVNKGDERTRRSSFTAKFVYSTTNSALWHYLRARSFGQCLGFFGSHLTIGVHRSIRFSSASCLSTEWTSDPHVSVSLPGEVVQIVAIASRFHSAAHTWRSELTVYYLYVTA